MFRLVSARPVLTNIDKNVVTMNGRRVKFNRITSPSQLVGGKRYVRFIVNLLGQIIMSDYEVIGKSYMYHGSYPSLKIKVRYDSYLFAGGGFSEYYLSDFGAYSRRGNTGLFEFDNSTYSLMKVMMEHKMVDEALLMLNGFEYDLKEAHADFEIEKQDSFWYE